MRPREITRLARQAALPLEGLTVRDANEVLAAAILAMTMAAQLDPRESRGALRHLHARALRLLRACEARLGDAPPAPPDGHLLDGLVMDATAEREAGEARVLVMAWLEEMALPPGAALLALTGMQATLVATACRDQPGEADALMRRVATRARDEMDAALRAMTGPAAALHAAIPAGQA